MELGLLLFPVAVVLTLGVPHYPGTIAAFAALVAASFVWARLRQPVPPAVRARKR
jgi:hypothetical protein